MFTNINENNQNYLQEERKSSFYKTEIERSTEMTKESANRAVEKTQIARTAAQEISGTYQKTAIQAANAAKKAIEAAKQNLETAELIVGAIEYIGEQQQLTQPVLDAKVKEKATFKSAKQNIETGELITGLMKDIDGLQKVTKRILDVYAKGETTPSIRGGTAGIAVEDSEIAPYIYRDSKSDS